MKTTQEERTGTTTSTTTTERHWPPPADALYSDRIALFQRDPEQYFKEYPRVF